MSQYNLLKRVVFLLSLALAAVAADNYTDVDFGVSLDYSRFSIEGGVYLDVYLMIPQSAFTYIEGESGLEALVVMQAALIQDDLVPYPPDRWQKIFRVKDRDAISTMNYVPDISKFFVEAGEYILQVDVIDAHSKKRQRLRRSVSLELTPPSELKLSDITIASQIVKATKENEFTKYGQDIIPNAQRTFTQAAPMLYHYFEIYGLSGEGNYKLHTQVLSLNDEVVLDLPERTKKMPGVSAVEWGGMNTAGLASGIYKLSVTATDLSTDKNVNQLRTFYVLKPQKKSREPSATENDYANVNETQIDEIFAVVSIIMEKNDERLYKRSDIDGKRNVLTAFWDRNDPDPDTKVNEFKNEFYSRVQLANREYSLETEAGWKTDRGRVLIKYGKPNNIDRYPSSLGQKPWETWHYYEIEGGVQFIFVDRTGYGSFQLVHSDARDEVQDYNWERYLK